MDNRWSPSVKKRTEQMVRAQLTGQYRIAAIANWLLTANGGAARQ